MENHTKGDRGKTQRKPILGHQIILLDISLNICYITNSEETQ